MTVENISNRSVSQSRLMRSTVPWHLIEDVRQPPRDVTYLLNVTGNPKRSDSTTRFLCAGIEDYNVETVDTFCPGIASSDALNAGWLWCGKCYGHRTLIARYVIKTELVPESTESNYGSFKLLESDTVEWMWTHPDLWVRLQAAVHCDQSFITAERAEAIIRNEPMMVRAFCDHHIDASNVMPTLFASRLTQPVPFRTSHSITVNNKTLLAAESIRRDSAFVAERAASPLEANMDKKLTVPKADKMLRKVVAYLHYMPPNLEMWTYLWQLTRVPNVIECANTQVEWRLQCKLWLRRATNLLHLVRAAQSIVRVKLNETRSLRLDETVWLLFLFDLARHTATSVRNIVSIESSVLDIGIQVRHVINEAAFEACALLAFLSRNGRLPAGVLVPWDIGYISDAEFLWLAHLAEAATAACNNNNNNDAQKEETSRNVTEIYTMLWRHANEFNDYNYDEFKEVNKLNKSNADHCLHAALKAALYIKEWSVEVWQDNNIATAVNTLTNLYYSASRETDDFDRVCGFRYDIITDIRQLLRHPGASLSTGRAVLATGNTLLLYDLVGEDNQRVKENCLLTEQQLHELARNEDTDIFTQLAASPRLPTEVAEQLAAYPDDTVRLAVLQNQPNLSKPTITMLAFNSNKHIAVAAAKRLKE